MFLAIILALPVLLVLLLYLQSRQEQRRVDSLKALARRRGWRYMPGLYVDVPRRPGMELFTTGHNRAIGYHFSGDWDGFRFNVFEFSYAIGILERGRTKEHTVVHVYSSRLPLRANFVLRPERLFDRIRRLFGSQDIDFASDRRFSRRYLLRGSDETAIRALFTSELRTFLCANPGWCVQVQGNDLFYWREQRLRRPQELDAVVERAVCLTSLISAEGPASAPAQPLAVRRN